MSCIPPKRKPEQRNSCIVVLLQSKFSVPKAIVWTNSYIKIWGFTRFWFDLFVVSSGKIYFSARHNVSLSRFTRSQAGLNGFCGYLFSSCNVVVITQTVGFVCSYNLLLLNLNYIMALSRTVLPLFLLTFMLFITWEQNICSL